MALLDAGWIGRSAAHEAADAVGAAGLLVAAADAAAKEAVDTDASVVATADGARTLRVLP